MSEIWNLSALCRCCHKDGHFKSLKAAHMGEDGLEIYANMLCDTLGITIISPPIDASYSICEECIQQLREATHFKHQVLACERNFNEYCNNEQMSRTDFIKVEENSIATDFEMDDKSPLYSGDEFEVEIKNNVSQSATQHDGVRIKSETTVQEFPPGWKQKEPDGEVKQEAGAEPLVMLKSVPIEPNTLSTVASESVEQCKTSLDTRKKKPRATRVRKRNPITSISTKRKIKTKSLEGFATTDNGETVYPCKLCDTKLKDKQTLRAHIKEHHSNRENVYRCEHCHEQFDKQYIYIKHVKESHNDRPFKCTYCKKKCLTKSDLNDHENTHTKQKKFICNICNKHFAYKTTLRRHFSWHNGTNKKHICEMCGNSFNDRTNLAIHIRTVHEKLKLFHCTFCKKSFAAKKGLKIHLRNHTGERPYQCNICLASFNCSTKMKKHKQMHGVEMRYTCVVCKSTFADRGIFTKHVRSHVGNLPHKCHLCTKDFSCKYSLNRHVNEHGGIKPYECSICHRRFIQKSQVKRHMARKHDPNKSVLVKTKCDICKQNVANIEKHNKIHTVRPFSCHLCDKSYPENNALNRHIKSIHLENKSHTCSVCGKRYTHKKSLTTHMMKVHAFALKTEA